MKVQLLKSLLVLMIAAPAAHGGWIDCDVIQVKHDRLYFSVGTEARVFHNSRYVIACGEDTLCSGRIEVSSLGVGYSVPLDSLLDTLLAWTADDSCRALVETAGIDSISQIRIAGAGLSALDLAAMYSDPPWMLAPGGQVVWGETRQGNRIRLAARPEIDARSWTDDADAILGYAPSAGHYSSAIVVNAPLVAVLIPNLDKKANRDGVLTTSLYYRIGTAVLPHLFKAGEARMVTSIVSSDSLATRSFPYDPKRGRELLRDRHNRPKKIRIDYTSPSLKDAAVYLADVLSRDRVSVELDPGNDDADLILTFVPTYREDACRGLSNLHLLLQRHDARTNAQREAMDIVESNLESARESADSFSYRRYCRLAEQTMMMDLGMFLLFRPRLHFQSAPALTGATFDDDGRIDPAALVKLRLPTPGGGDTQ